MLGHSRATYPITLGQVSLIVNHSSVEKILQLKGLQEGMLTWFSSFALAL